MRLRLLDAPDALSDLQLLEMVLFLAVPRRDTRPMAERLLARFGSLQSVLAARPGDLAATEGLGDASATVLKLIQAVALRTVRQSSML